MAGLNHTVHKSVWIERHRDELPARLASLGPRLMQSEPGGAVRGELVRLCDEAQETILLCSFLLAERELEQALLRAARRGVRVYLLTASETRLDKELREDQDFDRKTMQQHKDLLDELAGRVLLRTAEHLHAKFLLTDVALRPRGVLLTSNLTSEALQRNWELAAFLAPTAVAPLWRLFTWAFWEQAQKELLQPGALQAVRPRGALTVPGELLPLHVTAADHLGLLREALAVIRGAQRTLLVSSFGFGHKEVMHALEARARAGVQVTVMTRPRPAIVDPVQQLSLAGVKVYGVPYLHGKALCADEERGLLMTANLDVPSMTHSFEVGVGLEGEDGAALCRALRGWEQAARWEFRAMADLRSLRGQRVMVSPDLRPEDIIDVDQHLSRGVQGASAQPGRASRDQGQKRAAQKGPRKKRR